MKPQIAFFLLLLASFSAVAQRPTVQTSVEVTANDTALENDPVAAAHITLNAHEVAEQPLLNRASGFTDLLTRTTPGVAADSNGFAHPLGEHADTSLSLDGQPITDQQAAVFSNQLDPAIIHTLNATTGAPAAEFGGKTSLVVTVNTRSGLGHPSHGMLAVDYGSFGTASLHGTLAQGTVRWGNFIAAGTSRSGRFLDTPEFRPLHATGSNFSIFDRVDYQPSNTNLFHLNLGLGGASFQTPNSYDTAAAGQDQSSRIHNANAAFGATHVFTPTLLATITTWLRHDHAEYLPSSNPLADDTASLAQDRTLTDTGFRAEALYADARQTLKLGATHTHTLLHEQFRVALTDPLFNAPCLDTSDQPVPGLRSASDCVSPALNANPDFKPQLLPYDLTRGGTLFPFQGNADVVQTAAYLQDDIHAGRFVLSPGLRYDVYQGLSRRNGLQPRIAIAWQAPAINTVLRVSYARLFETPYNENLIFANDASSDHASTNPFATLRSEPVRPGTRNQFNTGLQQQLGHHLVLDADYYWKFTDTAFDFDTLFNTPITFSVAWRKSKIDGLALRMTLRDWRGLSGYTVMGHVRSRFFTPQVGGLIFNDTPSSPVFRIDHGEEFEQTTHLVYRPHLGAFGRHSVWMAADWRFNSGLALPDTVPTYLDALRLTADQQQQMGLSCAGLDATIGRPIRACTAQAFHASRVRIPSFGTQNDDRNPVRVAQRNLVDLSLGDDRLLHWHDCDIGLRGSITNLTNRVALYNFLSTFSGTHFVPPRTLQAGLQFTF